LSCVGSCAGARGRLLGGGGVIISLSCRHCSAGLCAGCSKLCLLAPESSMAILSVAGLFGEVVVVGSIVDVVREVG